MFKRVALFLFSIVIGIALFVLVGQVVGWQNIKASLSQFYSWQGIIVIFFTILTIFIGGFKWKEILKGQDIKLPFWQLFRFYLAGFSIMYLFPIIFWGGEIFRGYALKKKFNINWSKGMTSILIERMTEWTANLIIIFFGLLIFLTFMSVPPFALGIVFGLGFLIMVGFVGYFYFYAIKRKSKIKNILSFFGLKKLVQNNGISQFEEEIFKFFKEKKKALNISLLLSFLRAGIHYLRAGFLIFFLGAKISPLSCLSIIGFNYLATTIPIPTALGTHEAIQAFAFNALGLEASMATAFTMLIRGAELICALIGLMFLIKFSLNWSKNLFFGKINGFNKNNNGDKN